MPEDATAAERWHVRYLAQAEALDAAWGVIDALIAAGSLEGLSFDKCLAAWKLAIGFRREFGNDSDRED